MKITVLQIAIIVFAVFSASFAQAQSTEVYNVDIPFDFSVGKKVYAAGSYRVELRGLEQKYFVIKDANGRNSYIANSTSGGSSRQGQARIDFEKVGGNYFLLSVSASDRTSNFPRAAINEGLAGNAEMERVTVNLSNSHAPKGK